MRALPTDLALVPASLTRRRGSAVIFALISVTLMSLLALSLLQFGDMAEKTAQLEQADVQAHLLRDKAVNIVTAQLRSAIEADLPNGSPRPWTSQPGAVQTFTMSGERHRIYKLYSDDSMVASREADLQTDCPKNWALVPGQYVDLNQPTIDQTSDVGTQKIKFPIVDPRAMMADGSQTVEGFSYEMSQAPEGTVGVSGNPYQQRLPMPVKWLYVLQDGTLGTLDNTGRFVSPSRSASHSNPIVGRIAFWTDDETCKVNINTASEGVYWDPPYANTSQERELAKKQPSRLEYHRQPGHPATVSLSSIFFPNQRFYPSGFRPESAPSGRHIKDMSRDDFLALLNLGRQPSGFEPEGTSIGGQVTPLIRVGNNEPTSTPQPALYASSSESLFSHNPTELFQGDQRSPAQWIQGQHHRQDLLERAKFFLTTENPAPETTLFGTPRIALWPIHGTLNIQNNAVSHHMIQRYSNYDRKVALLSRLGKRIYAVSRQNAMDGIKEMTHTAGGANLELFNYLRRLTYQPFPGFYRPEAGVATFVQKYGKDDLDTTLLSMMDYLRCANLSDGHLPVTNQYSNGCQAEDCVSYGQISPLKVQSENKIIQAVGRVLTVSEISLVIICRAVVQPNGKIIGDPSKPNKKYLKNPGDCELDVALLVESFMPSHGCTNYNPYVSIRLGGSALNGSSANTPSQLLLNGQPLIPLNSNLTSRSTTSSINDWIPWGGGLGVRTLMENVIQFRPIVVEKNSHYGSHVIFSGTAGLGNDALKLLVFDDPASAGASVLPSSDLVQVISLSFPDIGITSPPVIPLPTYQNGVNATLEGRIKDAKSGNLLIQPTDVIQSMILSHSDFRIAATQKPPVGIPTYVAHPQWGLSAHAHSWREPSVLARERVLGISKNSHDPCNPNNLGYFPDLSLAPGFTPDLPTRFFEVGKSVKAVVNNQPTEISVADLLNFKNYDRRLGSGLAPGNPPGPIANLHMLTRPDITGDFDNGLGNTPDGPYINHPEDGNLGAYAVDATPYFPAGQSFRKVPPVSIDIFSAHRHIPSAGMFGSLPSGAFSGVPWRTLLFRPHQNHFGATNPPDHLLMDLFWQPVVEPAPLSARWETSGKVNLNHRLLPFRYINRRTALHAALKNEALIAIPDSAAATYKNGNNLNQVFRHYLDAESTLNLWDQEAARLKRPFLSASEVCTLPLVPEGNDSAKTIDGIARYWEKHRLTGDNTRERPYARIYPKLTTRSNCFRIHYWVESIQVTRKAKPNIFNPATHRVKARIRGSCFIRRTLDISDPEIPDYAATNQNSQKTRTSLNRFYRWSNYGHQDFN